MVVIKCILHIYVYWCGKKYYVQNIMYICICKFILCTSVYLHISKFLHIQMYIIYIFYHLIRSYIAD